MKFIVWIREDGQWVEQGDGPLSKVTAERIAREIRQDFGIGVRVIVDGIDPNELSTKTNKPVAKT